MAAELRRFVENRPIRSRAVPPYERFWRWCKRNPGLAAANALAATLTMAIAVISSVVGGPSQGRARRGAPLPAQLVLPARSRPTCTRPRASVSAATSVSGSRPSSRSRGPSRSGRRSVGWRRNSGCGSATRRSPRWHCPTSASSARSTSPRPPGPATGSRSTADFARYAVAQDDGSVVVRRTADNAVLARFDGIASRDGHRTARFSPDGRYLTITREHATLQVWELASGRLVYLDNELSGGYVGTCDFHPGGGLLAVARAVRPSCQCCQGRGIAAFATRFGSGIAARIAANSRLSQGWRMRWDKSLRPARGPGRRPGETASGPWLSRRRGARGVDEPARPPAASSRPGRHRLNGPAWSVHQTGKPIASPTR